VLRLAPGHEKKCAAPIAVGAAPDCRVVIAKPRRGRRLCRIEFRVRTPLSLPAVPVVPPAVVMVMPPDLRHRAMVGRDPRRKRRDGGCLRNSGHGRKNQSCDRNRKCRSNHAVLLGPELMFAQN